MKSNIRNSNIELLRCVLMIMLLVLHFNGIFTPLPNSSEKLTMGEGIHHIQLLVESLTIIVVNVFILVSGYYGIKGILKKIISLYFICFFYSFSKFIFNIYNSQAVDIRSLLDLFLCFTHTPLWFIRSYIALLLFSPILNYAIINITQKQYKIILLLLSIYNIYMCWLWKAEINIDGYNVMNFIYLYFIGRYINIYKFNKLNIKQSGVIYLICCIIVYAMAIFCLYIGAEKQIFLRAIAYNNPFIIIASVAFFMIFLNINFQNKIINWVASSSLAVYIVHLYFWNELKNYISEMHKILSLESFIALNICMITILFVGSILIDKVRMIIFNPLQNKVLKSIKINI